MKEKTLYSDSWSPMKEKTLSHGYYSDSWTL